MEKIPDFVLDIFVETFDGFFTLRDLIKTTLPTKEKIQGANWIVSCEKNTPMIDAFSATTKKYNMQLITTPLGKMMVLSKK